MKFWTEYAYSKIEDRVDASPGVNCHSNQVKVSPTLDTKKVFIGMAMGTIRLSMVKLTIADEIDKVVVVFSASVKKLKRVCSIIIFAYKIINSVIFSDIMILVYYILIYFLPNFINYML